MAKIIGSGRKVYELSQSEKEQLKQELIDFESRMVGLWHQAKIPYPVHFSGGNEEQLFEVFKEIKPGDYIICTHRSHYHFLLAGGSPEKLEKEILHGDSMHLFDKPLNFFTSAIVAGNVGISVGLALALKKKASKNKVWCFNGDGAEDSGHFYEAVRYVDGFDLPCIFILEDNDRSVETPKIERYGKSEMKWPKCVRRYYYKATYPHVGTGKWVDFKSCKAGGNSF